MSLREKDAIVRWIVSGTFCFVSGHDFSRAVKREKRVGFSPGEPQGLKSLRENYGLPIKSHGNEMRVAESC